MIGNNEMRLCEGTMIEIVQQWLDQQMPKNPPKVTGVKSANDHYAQTFTVTLTGNEESKNV